MGVDYFPCGICSEIICDSGQYYNCANCEENICEDCYDNQVKNYKKVKKGSEEESYWGKDAIRECDKCSPKTKEVRIADLKKQLQELES